MMVEHFKQERNLTMLQRIVKDLSKDGDKTFGSERAYSGLPQRPSAQSGSLKRGEWLVYV